jgi:hypothetical protein
MLVYPGLLLLLPAIGSTPAALGILVGVGWGLMLLFNMANALIQTLVPDSLRGRVLSLYTLTFFGFMPIGALLAGAVAARAGERATVLLGAAVALAFGIATSVAVPSIRRQ